MTTGQQRKEMRERIEKATGGPWDFTAWASHNCDPENPRIQPLQTLVGEDSSIVFESANFLMDKNARFIAASRTDLPAVLDDLERARKLISELPFETLRDLAGCDQECTPDCRITELEKFLEETK